uniref:Acyl-CoA thioesterase 2 C-terminal domain-containing protein n=1 Tax=Anolis carolinensis TaxID=28377 RepID=H9GKK0_ANOCA
MQQLKKPGLHPKESSIQIKGSHCAPLFCFDQTFNSALFLFLSLPRDPNLLERYRQGLTKMLAQEVPIEMKPVNPPDFYHRDQQEPKQLFWVRARGHIGECDMKLHCCVAAYISDYAFLATSLLPHRHHPVGFLASLDHSLWFHAPFRADHWMLYECESPWDARGLVLAATCAQEGVIRVEDQPATSKL